VGLADNMFTAARPEIETFADRTFKYHVAFDQLRVDESIGAICVSRPTNPTGNVLTAAEIGHLHRLARQHQIPLIIDNAYGLPFPNIIFTEADLPWSEHTILCFSLSKFGLPAVRTGIIIARPDIAGAIAKMNGIINLALSSFGPALALEMISNDKVLELSQKYIRPYYQAKADKALQLLHQELVGVNYYIHKTEGAFFLWLWFPGLPISCHELYQRLKFPGLEEEWQHVHECIRVSYAMDDGLVSAGIKIIVEEVKRAFRS
ncbi:MAG: Valine--pyruvate transaminase, partial [Gammaproteobacteria bacterium]|nr:Valine--pyruvate transaminase [Gammaproteobacteria bacterium]